MQSFITYPPPPPTLAKKNYSVYRYPLFYPFVSARSLPPHPGFFAAPSWSSTRLPGFSAASTWPSPVIRYAITNPASMTSLTPLL